MATVIGSTGNDVLDGNGVDTISYVNATAGVTVRLLLQGDPQDTIGGGIDTLTNFANISGSAFDDTLIGDAGDNILTGVLGDDYLDGGNGNDTAFYANSASAVSVSLAIGGPQDTHGAGVDTLVHIENLTGSLFDDVLTGDDGDNIIDGGAAGRDTVSGGLGNDTLIGGSGVDTADYAYALGGVTVDLSLADFQQVQLGESDKLVGIESLIGSSHDDVLTGSAGANSLFGGDGDDLLNGGGSNDVIDGGAGIDTIDYSGSADAMRVDLSITVSQRISASNGNDAITNVENVIGGDYADRITGDVHDNSLYGGMGDDILDGGLGTNLLDGGIGYDTVQFATAASGVVVDLVNGAVTGGHTDTLVSIENVTGTAFDDVITGNADANHLVGGAGSDWIDAGLGDDVLDGGAGIDTLSFASNPTSAIVDLSLITQQDTGAGYDTFRGFENIVGTDYEDYLSGNTVANVIHGGGGQDLVDGAGGNDALYGDAGDDVLFGNIGNDLLYGGDGDDVLAGYSGNDQLFGGDGSDTVSYLMMGGRAVVDLSITTQQNTVSAGYDTLVGIENLVGTIFDDRLTGDAGDNHLAGSLGSDILTGGGGADTFVYQTEFDSTVCGCFGTDLVTDFSANDILDLTAIDADSSTVDDGDPASGTNEAFHIVSAFTGAAGEIALSYDAATNSTTLAGDTDGDGYGDFGIVFKGDITALTANILL
ncbi:calcium-binding protein [Flavisphingomonas formosensis]|uniref:calcium-binding protein n=1 Tax=Flavisphingomonas formosensis TaxID=861534 RepID=UPI0012F9188B|nr:calcium-binding protein [Sphingomonas formosensis]